MPGKKWPEWKDHFDLFRSATKFDKEEGILQLQVSSVVNAMGSEAHSIYNSFTYADVDGENPASNYAIVMEKFDHYFVPKKKIIPERTKCNERCKFPGDSVEMYIRTLHDMAQGCNFRQNEPDNIRDRLIAGMADKKLSQKLQVEKDDLTLEEAADIARHWELAKIQNASAVDAAGWGRQQKQPQRHNKSPSRHNQRKQAVNSDNKCTRCGYKHRSTRDEVCPAIGAECRKCGKKGQFASICRTKHVHEVKTVPISAQDSSSEH